MRITYDRRLRMAHAVKARLPWASVVCGDRHYAFITIDRGESVKYAGTDGRKSWAGSYPPVGSREVHILFGQEQVMVLENILPKRGEAQRCKELWHHHIHTREWQGRKGFHFAVEEIVSCCETWLRPVDTATLALPKGHVLEHHIFDLEPMEASA